MSIILKSSGNFPKYQHYLTIGSTRTEVFPLNFLSSALSDELETDQIFYRRKFNGTLTFCNVNGDDDFDLLNAVELSYPGNKVIYEIERNGAAYWNGYFSTAKGKFDLDKCTFEVKPLPDDDYVDLFDKADIQYNILLAGDPVSTHAYMAGFVDVNYTRNRWLTRLAEDSVLEYLAGKIVTGVTVSSTFFNQAPNNPVTLAANHLLYLTIAQKSDIIRPTSSNQANSAMMSWNELMDILWGMFQVKWNYVPGTPDVINVEHINWAGFTGGTGLDLRTQLMTVATNKYIYLEEQMPKYEKFAFMEADNIDFVGAPISYNSLCVDQNPETNVKETLVNNVTTDLEYIINSPDAIADEGFVILCNDATNHVEVEGGTFFGSYKLNMHLSWANLHHRYFRHNRVLINGYMNEVDTPFWTALKTKKQDCSAIVCPADDYDPADEIITELGFKHFGNNTLAGNVPAKVQTSTIHPTGEMKLSLLYGPPDDDAAIAAGVPDYAGGPPADPVAIAAAYINPTYFSAEWNWVVDGTVSGYLLDVSLDGFGTFVGIYHDLDVRFVDEWVVTGLTTGTNYSYRLRAYAQGGISGYSNIINVTTT